jgi:hypothetical protein
MCRNHLTPVEQNFIPRAKMMHMLVMNLSEHVDYPCELLTWLQMKGIHMAEVFRLCWLTTFFLICLMSLFLVFLASAISISKFCPHPSPTYDDPQSCWENFYFSRRSLWDCAYVCRTTWLAVCFISVASATFIGNVCYWGSLSNLFLVDESVSSIEDFLVL